MEHYKRAGREDVDRRIARILRKKRIAAANKLVLAKSSPKASTSKGKKRARESSPEENSSEESSSSSPEEEEEEDKPARKRTNVPFDDQDRAALVVYMARCTTSGWTKQQVYAELAKHVRTGFGIHQLSVPWLIGSAADPRPYSHVVADLLLQGEA